MSVTGLGQIAKCGTLDATTLEFTNQSLHIPAADITAAAPLPNKGFHILAPDTNPTLFTIPAGTRKGDVVEFLHRSGGNLASITPSVLHGAATVVAITGGGYAKFIWSGTEWYIIGRCGDGVANATAVAGYPVLS